MPQVTRLGLYGGPRAPYAGFAAAPTTAVITASITEAQVVAGGQTILISLTNDTWVTAGATFNAQRQNILNGLDSAQSETFGWNAEVRDKEVVGAVVRTSDTDVTITLTASPLYAIDSIETITVTIHEDALTTSSIAVTATPTFDVTPEAASGGQRGPITVGKKKRKTLKTPRARQATEQEYYLSKEFVEKIEKGVLEVAGVEMFLQTPVDIPKPPLSEKLTELSVIKDEVEREIAQLMREKVVSEYKVKVESYVKDMRQMEMKMYFIALALLDEDF
jgi:hypothetical protein